MGGYSAKLCKLNKLTLTCLYLLKEYLYLTLFLEVFLFVIQQAPVDNPVECVHKSGNIA
jgi:hypothetical protein